jgi:hypothetical protein
MNTTTIHHDNCRRSRESCEWCSKPVAWETQSADGEAFSCEEHFGWLDTLTIERGWIAPFAIECTCEEWA